MQRYDILRRERSTGGWLWIDELATLFVAVPLEPGREYAFQLNTPDGFGFHAADGVPLAPYPIRFRTGSKWRVR